MLGGHPAEVAVRLLGGVLSHRTAAGVVSVRLTEVEAYGGPDDPGSHAHRGRTDRNASMFGAPGTLYVYFTYGMHHCANVACGPEGEAGAVLLRAGEVVEGTDLARARRAAHRAAGPPPDRELARGPANLCRALALDLTHDGADLAGGAVTLVPATVAALEDDVSHGPRVGLREAPDVPWRWWLSGDPTVSQYRPAVPARRR